VLIRDTQLTSLVVPEQK